MTTKQILEEFCSPYDVPESVGTYKPVPEHGVVLIGHYYTVSSQNPNLTEP